MHAIGAELYGGSALSRYPLARRTRNKKARDVQAAIVAGRKERWSLLRYAALRLRLDLAFAAERRALVWEPTLVPMPSKRSALRVKSAT